MICGLPGRINSHLESKGFLPSRAAFNRLFDRSKRVPAKASQKGGDGKPGYAAACPQKINGRTFPWDNVRKEREMGMFVPLADKAI